MSTTELLIKSLELARAHTLGLLDNIDREPGPRAILAWRPGPVRAHIGWRLMHIAIVALVGAFPATAYSADSAARSRAAPESMGLTPFRLPTDFFPILPWDEFRVRFH